MHSRMRVGGSGRPWALAQSRWASLPAAAAFGCISTFRGSPMSAEPRNFPSLISGSPPASPPNTAWRPAPVMPRPRCVAPRPPWCQLPVLPRPGPLSPALLAENPSRCTWSPPLPCALRSPLGEGTSAAQELQEAWEPERWPIPLWKPRAAQPPTWTERASSWGAG